MTDLPTLLRIKVTFLKLLPEIIYNRLDFSEFVIPSEEIQSIRQEIEQRLNHYVMTYNAHIFNIDIPIERHLCANIKGAKLTKEQLKILNLYEKITIPEGIRLVVYQKPLKFIQPKESEIFKRYYTASSTVAASSSSSS